MKYAAKDRDDGPGRDHLDPERLARLIDDSGTALRDAEWRHLATCVDCHAAYADALRTLHCWHAGACDLPVPVELLAAGRGVPGVALRVSDQRRRRRRTLRRINLHVGAVAVAASLACVLLLPPRPASPLPLRRGGAETVFVRPVEGEILRSGLRQMEWQAVAGATQYLVQLRDEEGRQLWEGNTDRTQIRLPAAVRLVCGRGYRAFLTVRPPDLNPPGGASVAFRAGGIWDCALQRARRPDLCALLLGIAGLGLICLGMAGRRWP